MSTRLPIILAACGLALGCGAKAPIYSTTETRIQRSSRSKVKLSAMLDEKARNFVMRENAQEHNAPYKPGYNVRGETAPLTGIDAVMKNISQDWSEVVDIVEAGEPYDYESLSSLGGTLVMRADELKRARQLELDKASVVPDRHVDDVTDRAIMRFEVLAQRFVVAASTRNPDELVEVYTVLPVATPFVEIEEEEESTAR